MKIRVASIADMAAADALTPREWETLGRLAVRIEEIPSTHETVVAFLRNTASYRSDIGGDGLALAVQELMKEEGLNFRDWAIFTTPVLPKRQPLPSYSDEWLVDLRLRHEATTSKINLRPEPEHKPTLSEQHGDKR